jgi:hypothetical protein
MSQQVASNFVLSPRASAPRLVSGDRQQRRPRMKVDQPNIVRELGAIELDQVGGGGSCPMGPGCNCGGSSAFIENGLLFTTNCAGMIFVQHAAPLGPMGRA